MSFPRYESYKDSGVEWLGNVPEHWELKRLKRNLRLLTEKTARRENPVALENIESWSGRFIQTETKFEGEGIAFERGDILFGKLRPYLAKVYLADTAGEAVGDFHVMRPTKGIDSRFSQYQILNREFIAIVDGSTFGAKMPRVSWDFLSNMVLTTPPIPEQQTIAPDTLATGTHNIRASHSGNAPYYSTLSTTVQASGHFPRRHQRPKPQRTDKGFRHRMAGRSAGALGCYAASENY